MTSAPSSDRGSVGTGISRGVAADAREPPPTSSRPTDQSTATAARHISTFVNMSIVAHQARGPGFAGDASLAASGASTVVDLCSTMRGIIGEDARPCVASSCMGVASSCIAIAGDASKCRACSLESVRAPSTSGERPRSSAEASLLLREITCCNRLRHRHRVGKVRVSSESPDPIAARALDAVRQRACEPTLTRAVVAVDVNVAESTLATTSNTRLVGASPHCRDLQLDDLRATAKMTVLLAWRSAVETSTSYR